MNEEQIYKAFEGEYAKLGIDENYEFKIQPEQSDWQCYMFGNRPNGMGIAIPIRMGIVYRPVKGKEPNLFVRWMMRICFDCLWVKDKK